MKVKLLVHLATATGVLAPGDTFACPDDEAMRLVKNGFAAPIAKDKVKKAVAPQARETRG